MTFGEKLQKLRARAGLSQDQLAELLDVSRQAVSKWERNEAMPEAEKIVRISRQFGVSTDYLLLEELEEPETAGVPAPAAGLWVRVKQWCRNRGYLLAWVLAAWGGVRLLRESVDLARYARSVGALNGLTPGEWCLVLMDLLLLNVVPAALMAAAGAVLAIRGRRMAGNFRWNHLGWLPVLVGLLGTGFVLPWPLLYLAHGLLYRFTYVLLVLLSERPQAHANILWAGLWGTVVCLLVTIDGLAILILGRRYDRRSPSGKTEESRNPLRRIGFPLRRFSTPKIFAKPLDKSARCAIVLIA